jgi:signal transduction histidine kinase
MIMPTTKSTIDEQKKDEFISDLVHNLKGPLNSIVTFIEAMSEDTTTSTSSTTPAVSPPSLNHVLSASARRLSRLLDELVDYANSTI